MNHELYLYLATEFNMLHARIGEILTAVQQAKGEIMTDLTKITAQVTETNDVEQSAIVLLTNLSTMIESMKTDPVALQSLADSLKTKSDELAAAVVANTPSA